MLLTVVLACRAYPLSQVPIEGAPEFRDRVRADLAFFEGAVGRGRVQLHEIQSEPLVDPKDGLYNHRHRRIELDDERWNDATLYHELCHALVAQEDLQDLDPEPMREVADLIFAPDYPYNPVDLGLDYGSASRQWSEAVAQLCEPGPYWALDVVDGSCTQDPQDGSELTNRAARWMLDHVWSAFSEPDPLEIDPGAAVWAEMTFNPDPSGAMVSGTDDPNVVATGGVDSDLRYERYADLRDGRTIQSDLPPHPWLVPVVPPGLNALPVFSTGWPDGPAAILGGWEVLPLGLALNLRLFVHDGEVWRSVGDGCGSSEYDRVFTAGDGVWWASFRDGLHWVELYQR